MDVATLVIAVLGLLLSVVGLVWQAATYVLSGGRVKVLLKVGAASARGMLTGAPDRMQGTSMQHLVSQGYTQPIIAVEVRNVGRMAVTVNRWSIQHTRGTSFIPIGYQIGPALPYRLEPGASETWAVDEAPVLSMRDAAMQTLPAREVLGRPEGLFAAVELGDGRTCESRETLT